MQYIKNIAIACLMLFCFDALRAIDASARSNTIVCNVNSCIITTLDIELRTKMINATNQAQHNPTHDIVKNILIDEAIISSEAKNHKIIAAESEILQAWESIAHANNITVKQLKNAMQESNIDINEMQKYMIAQILASKVFKIAASGNIKVTQEEIKHELDSIKDKKTKRSEEDIENQILQRKFAYFSSEYMKTLRTKYYIKCVK